MSSLLEFKFFQLSIVAEHVVHVEVNRSERLNTFTRAMWQELASVFSYLSHNADVRVIVMSGSGSRGFSAGLDVHEATTTGILRKDNGLDPGRKANRIRRDVEELQCCVGAIEHCEKREIWIRHFIVNTDNWAAVICVLHGISFGFALDIATCCDVRICTSDVTMAVKEVDIGLAADIGVLNRLPKIVGSTTWVKDICFSARDFGADEALREGFVSKVMSDKTEALNSAIAMARGWAAKSPVAVQGTKELLNYSRDNSLTSSKSRRTLTRLLFSPIRSPIHKSVECRLCPVTRC